jgi:hypothetical protein
MDDGVGFVHDSGLVHAKSFVSNGPEWTNEPSIPAMFRAQ